MILTIIIVVVIVLVLIAFISVYNRLQVLINGAESTQQQVRVALKKRLDMITQLYQAVKSYAKFEKSTLKDITAMRSRVVNANDQDLQAIAKQSKGLLNNLLLTVENYPDLKTNTTVKELMTAIKNIEEEISRLRYTYNNIIQEYNTKISVFPSNIIAGLMGFRKKQYLQFEEDIEKTPNIEF